MFQERHGHLRVPGGWEESGIGLAEEQTAHAADGLVSAYGLGSPAVYR
jgi:hypothetical protein